MDFSTMVSRAAAKCNLVNSAGTFVDGVVSETDVKGYINDRYKETYMMLAEKYPEDFEVSSYANTVEDQAQYPLFTKQGDTSDSDAADEHVLTYVGVKYKSTDDDYTRCTPRAYKDLFPNSTDTSHFLQSSPNYIREATKANADADLRKTISIYPAPDAAVTSGLFIRYIETPSSMSADTDVPINLPIAIHRLLVKGAIADIWEQKGDWEKSERSENRFEKLRARFINDYQPTASDEPRTWRPIRVNRPRRRLR